MSREPRRIGLFGGSFDPVHRGHLHAARAALDELALERVVLVPAARPPHKPGRVLADGAHRLAMLELAVAGDARLGTSDLELRRSGPSYTVDTVRELPAALGLAGEPVEIFLVLGSDNLPGLPDWSRVEELLAAVQPVVVWRAGDAPELPESVRARLSPEAVAKLERGFLRLPPVAESSTELRAELSRDGSIAERVPPAVARYIREHGLYRSAAAG